MVFMCKRTAHFLLFCSFIFILPAALSAQTYIPPVGIPAPEFGINEQLSDYHTRPNPWNSETEGWYYIDQYHANASDNNSHGTPDNPRRTLPATIPAGSVVEIHGDYDYAPTGYDVVQAEGTPQAPVFIIGGTQGRVLRKWVFKSSYTIVENLEFTDRGKVTIVYPSHHVSVRHNNHHHIAGKFGGYGNSDAERVHHIVIYNNQIHSQEGWDANPDVDLDNHGIKFGSYVEDVWILENTGYNNGGSFIQVGDWNSPADNQKARRYYIGRNTAWANRQSPIGIKQSHDVIISENHLYNNHAVQTNAAGQSGVVFQYGPGNLWIINNRIHDSNSGITAGSNSGGIGERQYIIGNLIYNIHVEPDFDYNANTGWAPAAMMLAGGLNRYIINNTIYNADAGINSPGAGQLVMENNIIHTVTRAHHLFVEFSATADASSLRNNILFQPDGAVEIRWGSSQVIDLTTHENEYGAQSSGNLESEPLFADSASADFSLLENSPAIDAGRASDVYQTFFDLYGLDISRDINGQSRPLNNGWDIGALEFATTVGLSPLDGGEQTASAAFIYPNPVRDVIRLHGGQPYQSYRLYDVRGRLIQASPAAGQQIRVASLAPGIYFLRINTGREIKRYRFLKQ